MVRRSQYRSAATMVKGSGILTAPRKPTRSRRTIVSGTSCAGHGNRERQEQCRRRPPARARVGHGFGHQASALGGKLQRAIGVVRARPKIGMQNLVFNMRGCVHLERTATPAQRPGAGGARPGIL